MEPSQSDVPIPPPGSVIKPGKAWSYLWNHLSGKNGDYSDLPSQLSRIQKNARRVNVVVASDLWKRRHPGK